MTLFARDELEREPIVARVDDKRCVACFYCRKVCPYGAVEEKEIRDDHRLEADAQVEQPVGFQLHDEAAENIEVSFRQLVGTAGEPVDQPGAKQPNFIGPVWRDVYTEDLLAGLRCWAHPQ